MREICLGLAVALLVSCGPGDGSTLDEHGRAYAHPEAAGIGSQYGAVSFAPTYSGVSRSFFAQLCTSCHSGSAPAKGLDLSAAVAYDNLVRVPSSERPTLLRVEPGAPAKSYLVVKLEGGSLMVGRRMPRNQPARPDLEIDLIRRWISDGAERN